MWNVEVSPEALELLKEQGPKYQYGNGCLSDGIFGAWLAYMCGLGDILDREKVKSHLLSVYKYNFKRDLSEHVNPQRSGFALGSEGGLLLCTWPLGGQPALPFVYSNEVWTGIEYQVASHLLSVGCIEEGIDIVQMCRSRFDGRRRNPFNEYECGHWYAERCLPMVLSKAGAASAMMRSTRLCSCRQSCLGITAAFCVRRKATDRWHARRETFRRR